ncbi:hypothetical protein PQJ75_10125 [Rhodoplanes sp. TEM]|uniref:DUF5348 domain-containing protein n=1 Tax=Rhodoplanes tepidamans TaxID=200616 RepID=A0ABT5J871_RHOTP|nr:MULTISPECIES: hypothetical protein [Rhodoplanes]MDC7785819.1 hypothetical protein [Rhodoplanes tepidamans]MDC7984086.1 hypothetical protein [Rhodoplanes sp. TEM]MDQ0354618.1 hypothetical protein [Rhodoplanes tepidamans]
MNHKFRPGQNVRLLGGMLHRQVTEGPWEIVRQLPYTDGDFQYRIKSGREVCERVVRESEIEVMRR